MTNGGPRLKRSGERDSSGLSRRSLLSASLLGAVAASAAGCGSTRPEPSPARAGLPHGPDILIGACLELSGYGSVAGIAAQRGLTIAQDKINTIGVSVANTIRNVQLKIKDSGSDPQTAADLTRELIDADHVSVIIGGATAATSTAMADVAEKAAVPMLSTALADSIIRPLTERRFVFKLPPSAADVADLITAQLAKLGLVKIALLAETGAHGDSGMAALVTSAHNAGLQIVLADRLPLGAGTNFAMQAATQSGRVFRAKPDAVVVWSVAPTSDAAAASLRLAGYTGPMFFDTGAAAGSSLSPQTRAALEGSYLVGPSVLGGAPHEVTTPASGNRKDFVDDYTRRYGTISGLAVYAADALNLVAASAARYGSSTPVKVRNALESFPFSGLAGTYSFSTINHGGVDRDLLTMFQLSMAGWLPVS